MDRKGWMMGISLSLFIAMTLQPTLFHDAYHYLSYIRSLWFDRDLNFRNEWKLLSPPIHRILMDEKSFQGNGQAPDEPEDAVKVNIFPPGSSILWTPFYVSHVLIPDGLFSKTQPEGFSTKERFAASLGTVFYTLAGVFLIFRLVRRHYDSETALFTCLSIALASPLIAYYTREPLQSEALSFFAAAWCMILTLDQQKRKTYSGYFLMGVVLGLNMLVRWQNIMFGIFPLIIWGTSGSDGSNGRPAVFWRGLSLTALAAGIVFLPQFVTWHLNPHTTMIDYGGVISGRKLAIVSVLFSANRSLFVWSPMMLIGLAGCFILIHKHRALGLACLSAIAIQVIINAGRLDWWGGAGFGARRFIGCLPFFALGIAAFHQVLNPRILKVLLWCLLAASIVYSLLLLNSHYNLYGYPPSNESVEEIAPGHLIQSARHIQYLFTRSINFGEVLRENFLSGWQFRPLVLYLVFPMVFAMMLLAQLNAWLLCRFPWIQAGVVFLCIIVFLTLCFL